MEDLAVCAECGWHRLNHHVCLPEAGRAADALARRAEVPSTKLGYGDGKLTFLLGKHRSLTLSVHKDGSFRVDSLHFLEHMDESRAAELAALLGAFAAEAPSGK